MERRPPSVPQIELPTVTEQRHGRSVAREMMIRLRHPDGRHEDLGPFRCPPRVQVAVSSVQPGVAAVVLYRTVTTIVSPWATT